MKNFSLSVLFLLIFWNIGLHAQKETEGIKSTFFDAEFFLVEEYYEDALPEYMKIYKRGFDNANISYKLGICYLNIPGEKDKSIPYLETATLNMTDKYNEGVFRETKAPLDALLFLGKAYLINNQLDKSIETYQKYLNLPSTLPEENLRFAKQQIEAATLAIQLRQNPVNVTFKNLGSEINTSAANYRPAISRDGKLLAFVTHLSFYDAIYISYLKEDAWSKSVNITPQIRSDGDFFTAGLSADGQIMILNKEDNFNSDIYMSKFDGSVWSIPNILNKQINTKYWESYGSLSPDGESLYFSSNRPGGEGEMDLYVSTKNAKGDWGIPQNLGKVINTRLNEEAPYLSNDGNTLFFSSQGHNTMGGHDIFYSEKTEDGKWSEPKNMGFPINSTDDDIIFVPGEKENTGYMAKFTGEGYGNYDLYKVTIHPGKPSPDAIKIFQKNLIEIPETKPEDQKIEKVIDQVKDSIVEAPKEVAVIKTDEVEEVIPVTRVQPEELTEEKPTFTLSGILFDFNSSSLSGQDQKKLLILSEALKEFPSVQVEVVGYADPLGSVEYNKSLSAKRAKAVLDFLMQKGISKSRLSYKALGETNFIAKNSNADGSDNPEGRKFNRRVEFNLSNIQSGGITIEPISVPDELKIK